MRKLLLFITLLFIISLPLYAKTQPLELYFFYGQGCPHCAKMEPYLESLREQYPALVIRKFEVYYQPQNQKLFSFLSQVYKTQAEGVPAVFVGDQVIVGAGTKSEMEIEKEVIRCLKANCFSPSERLERYFATLKKEVPEKKLGEGRKFISWGVLGVALLGVGFLIVKKYRRGNHLQAKA